MHLQFKKNHWKLKKTAERNFGNLSAINRFIHLATFYGEDGVLDLQKADIPKRFCKHLAKTEEEIDISVQPLVTLEERSMLVEISQCNTPSDIAALISTWYGNNNISKNCGYIRFALVASCEIWPTNALLNQ